MAPDDNINFVCPVCRNLDFNLLRKKDPPCTLDECMVTTTFLKLKASAELAKCLACQIICTGLETMRDEWDGAEEPELESEYLADDTRLEINLRRGHSLRITMNNDDSERIVEFYTVSEKDNASVPAFGFGREVAAEISLSKCLELTNVWIRRCDENHEICKKSDEFGLPSRVIDVGVDLNCDTVHLKETTETDRGPYMSLSHCWGLEQIITTTTKTLQARKAGIRLSELSKTFRHTVQITRGLGVRYLWIDSLCIIQDDMKDWEVESAKMADVYMNSHLNIAATHSCNGKGGCFAERWSLDSLNQIELNVGQDQYIEPDEGEEMKYRIYIRNALHVGHDHFTRSMDYANTMELASPLLSRAWVFQERLLSGRTLHFHAEELIWECGSGISCECSRLEDYQMGDPDGLLQHNESAQLKMIYTSIISSTATESQILDIWLEFVREYCSLKLTKQIDRLTALSGLASRVAVHLSGEYLAGLWSQDLPRALCWSRESDYRNKQPTLRDTDAHAPTWSWASIWNDRNDLPYVNYDLVKVQGFVADPRCEVQDFHCSRSGTNPFGPCEDTWIKIRAPVIKATFLTEEVATDASVLDWAAKKHISQYMRKKAVRSMIKFGHETSQFYPDCTDADLNAMDIKNGDPVCCILLGSTKLTRKELIEKWPAEYTSMASKHSAEEPGLAAYSLVLTERDGEYRRVGLLVHRGGSAWWKDAEIWGMKLV